MTKLAKPKQRLFIFERKEIIVFTLLFVTITLFTFTLGIHLKKKYDTTLEEPHAPDIHTVADQIPNGQELTESGREAKAALSDLLKEELFEEVKETNIKLDQTFPIHLPTDTIAKTHSQGAFYSLQVSSHTSLLDAEAHIKELSFGEPNLFIQEVELKEKGKRYRVYLGKFSSRIKAEEEAKGLIKNHKINSYIISKIKP